MSDDVLRELAPGGTLRAGINMGNSLLVTGRAATGDPQGVAPDMAAAVAERLGVQLALVPFATPGEVADAAREDQWDIALIGAEPQRAQYIDFSPAYVEIEATYLVPGDSPFQNASEVDREGVRIAVSARSAYDLYLERSLEHAELNRAKGVAGSVELFSSGGFDALAGLRPALIKASGEIPGTRVLDGHFTTVQQAIGTQKENAAGAAFLKDFVMESRASGLVQSLIDRHGVTGKLVVASSG